MKIIDENGKLFGKINLLDILFILLIVILLFGVWFRFFRVKDKEVFLDETTIRYIAKATNCRQSYIDSIKIGDKFYTNKEKNPIGEIKNISIVPYVENVTKTNGEVVSVVYPDRFDILMEVETNGRITDRGYYTNDNVEIKSGSSIDAITKYTYITLNVTKINI